MGMGENGNREYYSGTPLDSSPRSIRDRDIICDRHYSVNKSIDYRSFCGQGGAIGRLCVPVTFLQIITFERTKLDFG